MFGLFFILTNLNVVDGQKPVSTKKLVHKYIKTEKCSVDSASQAMFILNSGLSTFTYWNSYRDFVCKFERRIILKIFDKQVLNDSTFRINLLNHYKWRLSNETEVWINIFSVHSKGIKKSKIKYKNIKYAYHEGSVSIDNASLLNSCDNGDIIEIHFSKYLDYKKSFQSWQFDQTIPVLNSEYITKIPISIIYKYSIFGELELDINESEITPGLLLGYRMGSSPGSGRETVQIDGKDYSIDPLAPDILVRTDKATNLTAKCNSYTTAKYNFVFSHK